MRISDVLIEEIVKNAFSNYKDVVEGVWKAKNKDVDEFKKAFEDYLVSLNNRIRLNQLHFDDISKIIKSVKEVTENQVQLKKTLRGLEIVR